MLTQSRFDVLESSGNNFAINYCLVRYFNVNSTFAYKNVLLSLHDTEYLFIRSFILIADQNTIF